ncbi:hypothetical protein AB3X52_07545 [Nocardioides sp. DS6]|uniref:Uncharacterized protein n=1 Tax=Nocardioides eburneus TaxID=3231482 RepID=A0ABV3SWZ4_9ACTN
MTERRTEPLAGVPLADEVDPRPATLTWALRLIGILVLFSGFVVLLVAIRHDDLLRAWAEGNPSARRILQTQGLEALKHPGEFDIKPPHFVAPALTLWGVVAGLLGVLAVFLRNGFEWARIVTTLVMLATAVASVGGILTGPPALFVVLTLVAIAIGVAAIVAMWMPATTGYLHPRGDDELARLRERARV